MAMKQEVIIANIAFLQFIKKFFAEFFIIALPVVIFSMKLSGVFSSYLLSAYYLGVFIAIFIAGPMSDSLGRRSVLLRILPMFIVGSVLCFFGNLLLLFVGMFFMGIGIGSVTSLGRVMVFDLYHNTDKLLKVYTTISALVVWAPAIAMVFGAYLVSFFDWQWTFLTSFIIGSIALISVYTMPESHPRSSGSSDGRSFYFRYFHILKEPSVLFLLLAIGLFTSAVVAYFIITVWIFWKKLQIPFSLIGYYSVFVIAAKFLGNFVSVIMVSRYGYTKSAVSGVLISFFAAVLMCVFSYTFALGVVAVVGPMMLYMFGLGLSLPTVGFLMFKYVKNHIASCSSAIGMSTALFGSLVAFLSTFFNIDNAHDLSRFLLVSSLLASITFTLVLRHDKFARLN